MFIAFLIYLLQLSLKTDSIFLVFCKEEKP